MVLFGRSRASDLLVNFTRWPALAGSFPVVEHCDPGLLQGSACKHTHCCPDLALNSVDGERVIAIVG